MFQKKYLVANIIGVIILGIALPCDIYAKDDQSVWPRKNIVIRIPHEVVASQPKHQGMLLFKKLVEEAHPGKVKVNVYPAGQLMTDDKALDGCRTGAVEMAFPTAARFCKYDTRVTIVGLPYLLPNYEAKIALQDSELGTLIKKICEDKGFHVFGLSMYGLIGAATKDRIALTPSDYVGKRTRVFDTTCQIPSIEVLGGSAITMAASEYATALQQGVIDMIVTTASGWYGTLRSVSNHLAINGMFGGAYILVCSKNWYDSLPKELQQTLDQAGKTATEFVTSEQIKADERLYKEFGTTDPNKPGIFMQTPEQDTELMKATEKVYTNLIPVFGEDLIKAALEYRSKYRK